MDISCDKLNLLYLTNQTYKNKYNKLTEEKTKKSENFTKYTDEDIEFYRKRIFQLTKELLRGKNTNPSINNSFKHFANICIDHFQFEDAKEIYQKEYENLKTTNNGPKHFDASEVNKFMMKTEKPQEPKSIKDFLNVISTVIKNLTLRRIHSLMIHPVNLILLQEQSKPISQPVLLLG